MPNVIEKHTPDNNDHCLRKKKKKFKSIIKSNDFKIINNCNRSIQWKT